MMSHDPTPTPVGHAGKHQEPPSCGPAATLDNETLLAVALEVAGRFAHSESKVQFDRLNECRDELRRRLAPTPAPSAPAAPSAPVTPSMGVQEYAHLMDQLQHPAPSAPAAPEPDPFKRFRCDDRSGHTLRVFRSPADGDFHVAVEPDGQPRGFGPSVRICSAIGGGRHHDLYMALSVLWNPSMLRDMAEEVPTADELIAAQASDEALIPGDWWVVWSNKHKQWWQSNHAGYSPHFLDAGLYSRAEAHAIVKDDHGDNTIMDFDHKVREFMRQWATKWPETDRQRAAPVLLSRFTALRARIADLEAERDIAVAGMEELDMVASRARLRLHGAESRLAQAEAQLARVEARSRAARDAASEERCHAVCDVQGWLDEGTDAAKRKILDTVGWLVDHRYEDLYDLRAQLAAATARADQVRAETIEECAKLADYSSNLWQREAQETMSTPSSEVYAASAQTAWALARDIRALRVAPGEGPAGTEEKV